MSDFDALKITEREGAVRFAVRVQPRSSRTGIDGMRGDAVRVRVAAPPVDGAANEAVIEVLAESLGVPKRSIEIVSGATSRNKVVQVSGMSAEQLRSRISREASG